MKACLLLSALALVLVLPISARADSNWLENGHFTDGTNHWRGDGKAPSDLAPENPLDKPDPFLSEGLIIPLKHLDWTKVAQDFTALKERGTLLVVYKLSSDIAFSDKDDDYSSNMFDPDGFGYSNPRGDWSVFLGNLDTANELHFPVQPRRKSDVQTFRTPVSGMSLHHANTLTLEFPPGKGTVVILSVTLCENPKQDD